MCAVEAHLPHQMAERHLHHTARFRVVLEEAPESFRTDSVFVQHQRDVEAAAFHILQGPARLPASADHYISTGTQTGREGIKPAANTRVESPGHIASEQRLYSTHQTSIPK